jgi:hypothetical protein
LIHGLLNTLIAAKTTLRKPATMPSFTLENILSAGKNQYHGFKLPIGADTTLPYNGITTEKAAVKHRAILETATSSHSGRPWG